MLMKVKDFGLSFIQTEANPGDRVIHNGYPLMQDCHSASISINYSILHSLSLPIIARQHFQLSLIWDSNNFIMK